MYSMLRTYTSIKDITGLLFMQTHTYTGSIVQSHVYKTSKLRTQHEVSFLGSKDTTIFSASHQLQPWKAHKKMEGGREGGGREVRRGERGKEGGEREGGGKEGGGREERGREGGREGTWLSCKRSA